MFDKLASKKKALDEVKDFARQHMAAGLKAKYAKSRSAGSAGTGSGDTDENRRGTMSHPANNNYEDDAAQPHDHPAQGPVGKGRQTTDYHSLSSEHGQTYAARNGAAQAGQKSAYSDVESAGDTGERGQHGSPDQYFDMKSVKGDRPAGGTYAQKMPQGMPGKAVNGYAEHGRPSYTAQVAKHSGAESSNPYASDDPIADPTETQGHMPKRGSEWKDVEDASDSSGRGQHGRTPPHNADPRPAGTMMSDKENTEYELSDSELKKLLAMRLTR